MVDRRALPVLAAVDEAARQQRDPIGDSDLDGAQPVVLTVHLDLQALRGLRALTQELGPCNREFFDAELVRGATCGRPMGHTGPCKESS